jgi:fatty-acyl-CoA synthase
MGWAMDAHSSPWVEGKTIGQALKRIALQTPDNDALVFPQFGFRRTWREFDRDVDAAAKGLIAQGFGRGDHFAVWCTNRPEWVVLQFATARIGVVLVTINPAYRSHELAYVLRQSDAKGLALFDRFKGSDYRAILEQACPEAPKCCNGRLESATLPRLKLLLSLAENPPTEMPTWNKLLESGESTSDRELAERSASPAPQDKINLQYTSGTTGFPKGALLSHRNLLFNVFHAGNNMRCSDDDRICIPVPLYHCFGCVLGTLLCAVHGAAMVFPFETFDAGRTLDAVESERCTALYGVPTMFIALLEHHSYKNRNLNSLRTGIMAGSPCPLELMRRVTGEMGAREMTIGYGQTEASPLLTQTRYDDPLELRVGTVGKPMPGVEVRIIGEGGRVAVDGVSGELCARGHPVMLMYYNDAEASRRAVDEEGWLHTGDLALRESNGYFRITGRLKDVIIRGGENIYPREVEECLYLHPDVEEVQVVGVPDEKYGEEVLAWIKLRSGATTDEECIRIYCQERLARFKSPRYIKFVNEFPMTVTGKIQKYRIREIAINELKLQRAASIETA